jgi:hypothetical protein
MTSTSPETTGGPQGEVAQSPDQPSGGAVSWRSVALPSEHGGWSLTAEPVVLGLLVAWSWSGLALGVAAMLGFVARTPLKLVLVDRWRHRRLERTRMASWFAAGELTVVVVLVALATATAAKVFWLPLLVAAPMILVELWYDMRSRSRRLIPELAGAAGIGSIATAIALAGGLAAQPAWGLWLVVAARSIAAIPYVRTQILRTGSRPSPRWRSDAAQAVAVGLVLIGWSADLVPGIAAGAVTFLAAANIVLLRLRPRPAMVIGLQQMAFGLIVIVTTAFGVRSL